MSRMTRMVRLNAPHLARFRRGLGLLLTAVVLGLQARSAVQADVLQLATQGSKAVIERRFFGMHAHRLDGVDGPPLVRRSPWRTGEAGGMRLWDAYVNWFDVNRAPGQFEFGRVDAYLEHAWRHEVQTLYPLGMTPAWASRRPAEPCPYGAGCAAEPRDLEDWRAYVRAVLGRYRGTLSMVEVWNEPYLANFKEDRGHPGAFFTGDAATLVAMTRIVREAIDELSPSTRLCSPGFVGSGRRLELFLQLGGGEYLDAVCHHFYAPDTATLAANIVDVRHTLVRAGRAALPLLNTESGLAVEPAAGEPRARVARHAAARLVQQTIFNAMAGLEAHYYYAWDDEKLGFFEPDGSARPGLQAWGVARRWLTGVQPNGCRESTNYRRVVLCTATRDGVPIAWVWHDLPARRHVSLAVLRRELGAGRGIETVQPLFDDDMPALKQAMAAGTIELGLEPLALTLRP